MSWKKQEEKQVFWPGNFWAGDICAWGGDDKMTFEIVEVVSAKPSAVPAGCVPVVYAYQKKRGRNRPMCVPADSLTIYWETLKRYPPSGKKRISWAMDFAEGNPVSYEGRQARVAAQFPQNVPLGYVPFYYDGDKSLKIHYAPADSLYRL